MATGGNEPRWNQTALTGGFATDALGITADAAARMQQLA
jgi:hypothetical protein